MFFTIFLNLFYKLIDRYAAQTTANTVYYYVNGFKLMDPGCTEGFGFSPVCNTSFHSSEIPLVFSNEATYKLVFWKKANDNIFINLHVITNFIAKLEYHLVKCNTNKFKKNFAE